MKNLILTMCLLMVVSLTYAQLHVVKGDDANDVPNGAVGIGTSEPKEMLEVAGNGNFQGRFIRLGTTAKDKGVKVQIGKGRTEAGNAIIDLYAKRFEKDEAGKDGLSSRFAAFGDGTTTFTHYGDEKFAIKTRDEAPIHFETKSTTRMFISPTGKVGIGTENPTVKLEIIGSAKKPGGGDWDMLSDKRTKKNINRYEAGLAEVLKLNPVTYNYNGKAGIADTESTYVGLIAQEFAEIEPNAVNKFEHTEEGTNKTEEFFSMNASSVRYMLVNGMKEQQALIEAQKAALETLKTEVAELKANGASITTPGASEMSVLLEGSGTENALLAQNSPNPFTTNTRIEYFIPTDSRHCRLSFRDMNGKELKRVNIEHDGIGAIELSAKDLSAGIYSYVLYVNGDIVASKKMILRQ